MAGGKGKKNINKLMPPLSKEECTELDIQQRNQIIDKMRGYPQVYDKSHELYKRTDLKKQIFEQIAKEIGGGLTAKLVQSKWKNLVDKARTKFEQSGSGGPAIKEKVKQWTFFREMSFMRKYIGTRE